jgi:hypothetical protein
MDKTTIIYACSAYYLVFALFHIGFWKLFNWRTELNKLNFANRAIMQILNLRITFMCFLMAFIYFKYPQELINSPLGNALLIGMFLFWAGRTIEQFIFFKSTNKYVNFMTGVFILGTVLHFFSLKIL